MLHYYVSDTIKKFYPKKPVKMDSDKRETHSVENNKCIKCGLNFVIDHNGNEFCEANMYCYDVIMFIAINGSI